MSELTKADLQWVLRFVENYEYLIEEYPELFTVEDIDDVKVVKQILEEKLA
jgi:hypothetical protein